MKGGFEQHRPGALRPAGQKIPSGAFLDARVWRLGMSTVTAPSAGKKSRMQYSIAVHVPNQNRPSRTAGNFPDSATRFYAVKNSAENGLTGT